jgi:hypothetical protein
MKSLFDEMRSETNLFSAWRHVKRSALISANPEIRGKAAEFEHQHQTYLHTIARQLQEHRFVFDDATGVLKDKKKRIAAGKDPRPIAVATIRSRVVQRAILQVLQPRKAIDINDVNTRYELKCDPRLQKINDISRSKYGVGGLLKPYGGVRPAITCLMKAMREGAIYYFQSDIKSFFTKIPVKHVVDFVRVQTKDDLLANIFACGLEVNLSNPDELLTYAKLFPSGGIGVAQGSSLSAFAGNVLLYDFDHHLNNERVTAVRYIDDLLMVSSSKDELEKAIEYAKEKLGSFGFSLYEPARGSDKAAKGECSNSFNFLGCTIQPNRCVPSVHSIHKINKDIAGILSKSRSAIQDVIASKKALNPTLSHSAVIQTIGRKLYGWQRSFDFCTDPSPFCQLDKNVATKIDDYHHWLRRNIVNLDLDMKLKIYGIPSTGELFLQSQHAKRAI